MRFVRQPVSAAAAAESAAPVRLDKWLWAVRLFKTRSLATEACQAGHVTIRGERVKPAHLVRPGEVLEVRLPAAVRTVKVLAPLDRRVGAPLVARYLEDLTPPAARPSASERPPEPWLHRPRGSGRPTKRDRRHLQRQGLLPPDP